jgi:Flp pilus assembly protein TadG
MTRSHRVPGALGLPGRARPDEGAVAVEAAISLLALVVVVAVLVWGIGLLGAQLAVGEAARAAARAAARGESSAVIEAEARRLAPDASVSVTVTGDRVEVGVARSVGAPGGLARLGTFDLSSSATAAVEPVAEAVAP